MTKSNKKIFITILGYISILAVVILLFVTGMAYKSKNDVLTIYRAKAPISRGMEVTTKTADEYFEQVEVSKSSVDTMINGSFTPVFYVGDLSNQKALTDIAKGSFLGKEMFGVLDMNSILDEYRGEGKFINPYYSVLKADKYNAPISSFKVGQKISIEGTVSLSNSTEENLKDDAGEIYNGIITNKCVVHNIIKDENGNITHVGVIVELQDYPTINFIHNYGTLKFHEGVIEETWETTNNKILNELWEKTGFKDTIAKRLNTYVEYNISDNEKKQKKILAEYNGTEIKENVEYSTIHVDLKSDITLYTPYNNMIVSHYNLDGTIGNNMDITGINTHKRFNSRTGLYELKFNEEGIYSFLFFDKIETNYGTEEKPDIRTKIALVNQAHIIVEKENSGNRYIENANIQLIHDEKSGNTKLDIKASNLVTKDYYNNVLEEAGIDLREKVELGSDIAALSNNISASTKELGKSAFVKQSLNLGTIGTRQISNIYVNGLPLFVRGSTYTKLNDDERIELLFNLGLIESDNDKEAALKKYKAILDVFDTTTFDSVNKIINELESSKEDRIDVFSKERVVNTSTKTLRSFQSMNKNVYLLGRLWFGEDPLKNEEFNKNLFDNFKLEIKVQLDNDEVIEVKNVTFTSKFIAAPEEK